MMMMMLHYVAEETGKEKSNLERRRETRGEGQGDEGERDDQDARSSGEDVRGLGVCETVGKDSAPALHRS